MSIQMFAHYYVKISKQSNDISRCFPKYTKFIYTIYSRRIINLIIKNENMFVCCKIMKYFYFKLKYNLIATNKNNPDENFHSLNNSKLYINVYGIVPSNVCMYICFNMTKRCQNPL